MQTTNIICLIVAALSAFIKLMFWLLISSRKKASFLKSFIKHYNAYDKHNAGNKEIITFYNISNFINIFFWVSLPIALFLSWVMVTTID